jgi:hypothetical protein
MGDVSIPLSHPGRPFRPNALLNKAVCNVIASLIFARRFEYDDPRLVRLLDQMDDALKEVSGFIAAVSDSGGFAWPALWAGPPRRMICRHSMGRGHCRRKSLQLGKPQTPGIGDFAKGRGHQRGRACVLCPFGSHTSLSDDRVGYSFW